jgi:hypothetical protein
MMVVAVLVLDAGSMKMNMLVGLILVGGTKPPDQVGDTKTYQEPSGKIAAEGFDKFEFLHS